MSNLYVPFWGLSYLTEVAIITFLLCMTLRLNLSLKVKTNRNLLQPSQQHLKHADIYIEKADGNVFCFSRLSRYFELTLALQYSSSEYQEYTIQTLRVTNLRFYAVFHY